MKKLNDEDIKLDKYEQELEDNFDKLGELPPDEEEKEIKMLVEAAKSFNKQKKDKRITIRIYSKDLEEIKKLAAEDGLPYLHKFTTGKLTLKAV